MADYAYPNRIRAYTALLIFRDAMRPYVARVFESGYGPKWLGEVVLDPIQNLVDEGKGGWHLKNSLTARQDARLRGTDDHLLIDFGDIPRYIGEHRSSFPDLTDKTFSDIRRIRDLRNRFLEHDFEEGDCNAAVVEEIIKLCSSVLVDRGLSGAAEAVARLPQATPDAPAKTGPGKSSQPNKTRSTAEQRLCVCGCGGTTKSTFKLGHDGRLVRIIRRGSDAERAGVDWQRVPLEFHNGNFAEEIRRYQSGTANR